MANLLDDPATWFAGFVSAATMKTKLTDPINAAVGPGAGSRLGARATTTVAQSLPAGTLTALNNNGTAAWTATEDSGGFVSASTNTTTPITVPAGAGGLYIVGFGVTQSAAASTSGRVILLISGALSPYLGSSVYTGQSVGFGATAVPLAAGATLGVSVTTTPTANASAGCHVFCYRIGN